VILGVERHGSPFAVSPGELLRGRTVTGSLFGGLKPKSDIPLLAQKYLDKVVN
jgi:S-(hydroxymethyl)glutathione dehydrogenase/alcohol dehydrogenase